MSLMLLGRKQTGWVTTTLVLAALGSLIYWFDPQAPARGHRGSNWVGLGLGAVALVIFLFCSALALKRKVPHWRLGRAQGWLRGHVWLGLLAVWLVALHAGFRAGGPMTIAIWVLTGLVTVSAVFGIILQQFIPRLVLHSIPGETLAQQLERLLAIIPPVQLHKPGKDEVPGWPRSLQEQAFSAVVDFAGQGGSIEKQCPVWDGELGPAAGAPLPGAATIVAPKPAAPAAATPAAVAASIPAPAAPVHLGPVAAVATAVAATPVAGAVPSPQNTPAAAPPKPATAGAPKKPGPPMGAEPLRRFYLDYAQEYFAGKSAFLAHPGRAESLFLALRTMTPAHIHPGVDALAYLTDRRRQLVRQRALLRTLYSWLIVHVPLSWSLLVLTVLHAFMDLRYISPPAG